MLQLVSAAKFFHFTACAWGSSRPTKKAFLSTLAEMSRIEAECPGNHEHEPYGRKRDEHGKLIYATAEEAAYPRALCVQIRRIVQEALNIFPETYTRGARFGYRQCRWIYSPKRAAPWQKNAATHF